MMGAGIDGDLIDLTFFDGAHDLTPAEAGGLSGTQRRADCRRLLKGSS